jgi:hypothetical protein
VATPAVAGHDKTDIDVGTMLLLIPKAPKEDDNVQVKIPRKIPLEICEVGAHGRGRGANLVGCGKSLHIRDAKREHAVDDTGGSDLRPVSVGLQGRVSLLGVDLFTTR